MAITRLLATLCLLVLVALPLALFGYVRDWITVLRSYRRFKAEEEFRKRQLKTARWTLKTLEQQGFKE